MSAGLLNEYETMLNLGLGAIALSSFTKAFIAAKKEVDVPVTLWHLATVLPLVFHQTSRRAIAKRQVRSGLRSTLTRDPDNDIAQNEAIFNLTQRMKSSFPRTVRSLNCAVAWGLLQINDGNIVAGALSSPPHISGEAQEIVKASAKLGTWAGGLNSFEYFTVLGVDFN